MSACERCGSRKGTNGVSAYGVTASFMFFDTGTFCALPLTYSYLFKRARAYLFPQSVKIHYFCICTVSVDLICPQPRQMSASHGVSWDDYIYIYIYIYYDNNDNNNNNDNDNSHNDNHNDNNNYNDNDNNDDDNDNNDDNYLIIVIILIIVIQC